MDTHILRRERLRRAIEAREATQATVRRLRAIVTNAAELVNEATTKLRQLKRREVEAADIAASALADALRRGEPAPAAPHQSVAAGATADASAQHATAKAAHDAIAADLIAAERQDARASGAIFGAALAVLEGEGESLAEAYVEAQRQADHLRASLDGLAATWLGAPDVPPRPVALPPSALHAMTDTRPEPSASHAGEWSDAWKHFHAALMRDADAAIASPDRPAPRMPTAAFRMPTPDPYMRDHLVAAASRIPGAKIFDPNALPDGVSAVEP